MNNNLQYIRCCGGTNHEWDINRNKVILSYFSKENVNKLEMFINTLENRLMNKTPLIVDEDALYGRHWGIPNAFELCSILFTELTCEFIKHFIEVAIEQENNYSIGAITKLILGKVLPKATDRTVKFCTIIQNEQLKKMEELEVFKYNFQEYSKLSFNIQFSGENGENKTIKWVINGKEVYLNGFYAEDKWLLYRICFELQKRLENQELLLDSRCTFHPIKMGKKNIITIAWEVFTPLMERYLQNIVVESSKSREVIGITRIYNSMLPYGFSSKGFELETTSFDKMLRSYIEEYNSQILHEFEKTNFSDGMKGDTWILYKKGQGTNYSMTVIDFSEINRPLLKVEIKAFIKFELEYLEKYEYASYILRKLKVAFEIILEKYPAVLSCADITINMVRVMTDYLETESTKYYSDNRLTVSTQAKITQKLKQLFEFLINNDSLAIVKPEFNPCDYVSYLNLEAMEERTEPIPDNIIMKILANIDDLESIYQRVLLISLNTGLRFKEIAYLDENDMYFDEEHKAWVLEYIPWKILEARRQQGLDDYVSTVIKDFLADEIREQTLESMPLREQLNSHKIFLKYMKTVRNGRKVIDVISADEFNRQINDLIKKHNIMNDDGQLWEFSHKQCRKTLAVDMITGGASSEAVAQQLGHLKQSTTDKFYSEVRKYKLAEMNSEFFRKKFNLLITEEQLSKYSEDERKLLYVGFCSEYREVELGKCIKPFSEGVCKRSGMDSCATCDKLCTSIESLPKWEKLFRSKEQIIRKLQEIYLKEGIPENEYCEFREYQKEMYLHNAYFDVIKRIKKEGEPIGK